MFGFLKKLFGGDAAPQKQQSLYERIGGDAAVNAAVDVFYRKVLADKRINKFFEGVDMGKQAAKQKAFLTMAFGGPNNYTGEDMRLGHAHLVEKGMNASHFDAVMENLGATLKELGVPGDLIGEAAKIAESVRKDVLAGYTPAEKAAMASKQKSLFERIGGEGAVNAAVDVFYRKVLSDKRISHFFEGVDMGKQAAKQKAFLTMAFGGPSNYTGEDMRLGHAHLVEKGMNASHFDAVMENLGATLTELGVPGDLIGEAAAIAESVRKDVLAGYTPAEKAAMASKKSLFERIGGDAAVNAAVDVFYRKVLSDKRISHFFEGVDMGKQAAKQKAFLTMAFGGPANYTGEDMRRGHAHLVEKGMNASHFDAVMENLGATLTELGVPGDLIGEAAKIAESVRADVLAGYTPAEKAAMASKKSLYERIGGDAAVNAAVDVFYRKVLSDKRISHFFEGVDMGKQAAKQKAFLTFAFGGPANYSGKDMRAAHAHLVAKGLNDSHFDAVMENLGATLTELGVPGDLIAEAAAIAESTRNDVLGR